MTRRKASALSGSSRICWNKEKKEDFDSGSLLFVYKITVPGITQFTPTDMSISFPNN
ncbi:hypothetical protein PP175_03460 [Aneurinibacillus sp. Ricciae_BoGa-3]|uniref:hypothetical protein n=1 Tax=Aneurinibacillus sp. Ricciae_BoGa-3 TaxID=3022697 RepID=UPI002341C7BC|nr:hypothetical protein [Aneurinibacillus sp. Ricciae_BoGa-3]WCK55062.1 hypothetical protein PP175_03460 [Aneurinibacillus sp. Ricciae_BoGa-3]